MFGSRFGRGVKGAVSLGMASLMTLGMLAGCNGKPKPKAPEEVAADLVKDASAALKEGRLDDAQSCVDKAKAAFAGVDLGTIEDEIAKAREDAAAAALKRAVDADLADGKAALDAKNYPEAIAKAKAALEKDPGNVDAEQLQSDAEAAKKAAELPKEDPKAEYAKVNDQINAADRSGDYATCIRLVGELEPWAVKDGGPSRKADVPKFEAKALVKQARDLVNSNSVAQLDRAIRMLEDAKQKDPANADAVRLLEQVTSRKDALAKEAAAEKQYVELMRRGREKAREDRIPSLEEAIRLFEEAERVALDEVKKRAPRDEAKAAREKITYFDNFQKAQQAVGRNDLDAAREFIAKALEIRRTREARDLQDQIEGKIAEKAGDAATAAADWATAVEKYSDAESRGIDVADRLKKAREMLDVGAIAEKVAFFAEKGEALEWGTVAEEYAAYVKEHADNAEVAALGKKYPLKPEQGKLDKAAAAEYKAILAVANAPDLKDRPQEKIAALEQGLPKVRGSRYEGMINKAIERERDGIYRGAWTELMKTVGPMKELDQKISAFEQERERFQGTSFAKQLETQITNAKNQRATAAYNEVKRNAGAFKPDQVDDKISMLQAAQGQAIYKDTRYEGMIANDITAAKNQKATSFYNDLNKEVGAMRKPEEQDAKIAKLGDALRNPGFRSR